MGEDLEDTPRVNLEALKKLGSDGEIAVNEIQDHFSETVSRSGGTITGPIKHESVKKEPDAQTGRFIEYQRTLSDGTLEYVLKDPGGNITVLASFTP